MNSSAWCGTEGPFGHSVVLSIETLSEPMFIRGELEHWPTCDLSEPGFFSPVPVRKAEIIVISLLARKSYPYCTKLLSFAESTQLFANFFEIAG